MRVRDRMERLTVEDVLAIIGRITYKPTWEIEARRADPMGLTQATVALHLSCRTVDVNPPHEPNRVASCSHLEVALVASEQQVIHWVRDCIRSLEEHEADEWFRIDGTMLHDPHASRFEHIPVP